jgi:D-inositol-3-phosphate glycosyltransferase
MRPFHVDLISEHASPLAALGGEDAGGQNVYVAALATELGRLDCTVRVFTRRDDVDQPERVQLSPNVTVDHVDAGPPEPVPKDDLFPAMPGFAAALRRRWATSPPDLVHAHFWMSGWAAVRAAAGPLGSGVPVVQTFHALGTVKQRHQGAADTSPPARLAVEATLVRQVDKIVASCADERRELEAMGATAERVAVVPCGVDPTLFRPNGPVAARHPGLAHRIVMVTRMVPRKGVEDVVRALADLPDTELVIAGGPPAPAVDDDPEVRRLRTLAGECGVGARVRFLGGIAREDVPALLRSADLVASAPWYEPFGIVPLEAMACGVPVLGTAVGGLLDTVVDGRTGLLVPPRDHRAIAAAASRLLANPSLRLHMGQEAAARMREHYTWQQVAWSTLGVYDDVRRARNLWAVPA